MFSYSMVSTRIQMIFDLASIARSNLFSAMQASNIEDNLRTESFLADFKKNVDAMMDQYKDMQIEISRLKDKE